MQIFDAVSAVKDQLCVSHCLLSVWLRVATSLTLAFVCSERSAVRAAFRCVLRFAVRCSGSPPRQHGTQLGLDASLAPASVADSCAFLRVAIDHTA